MLKPIQNTLNSLVYADDRQITDATTRKTPPANPIKVLGKSIVLLQAFTAGREFVRVVIDHAPDHTTPLR